MKNLTAMSPGLQKVLSALKHLSSMCMNGGDEKPFACPVPGCKKRYKVSSSADPPYLFLAQVREGKKKPVKSFYTFLI